MSENSVHILDNSVAQR